MFYFIDTHMDYLKRLGIIVNNPEISRIFTTRFSENFRDYEK